MICREVSVYLLILSCHTVLCTFGTIKISKQSHPLLASVFSVAKTVQQNTGTRLEIPLDQSNGQPIPDDSGFSRDMSIASAFTSDMWCSLCKKQNDIACIKKHCWNTGPSVNRPGAFVPGLDAVPVGDPGFNSQLDRHDLLINAGLAQPSGPLTTDVFQPQRSEALMTLDKQLPSGRSVAPVWSMAEATFPEGSNSGASQVWLPLESVPVTLSEIHRPVDVVSVQLANGSPTQFLQEGNPRADSMIPIVSGGMTRPELNVNHRDAMGGEPIGVPTEFLRRLIESSSQLDSMLPALSKPLIQNTEGVSQPFTIELINPDNSLVLPDGFVGSVVETPKETVNVEANRHQAIPTATDIFSGTSDNVPNRHTHVVKTNGDVQQVGVVDSNHPITSGSVTLLESPGQVVPKTGRISNVGVPLSSGSDLHLHHDSSTANVGGSGHVAGSGHSVVNDNASSGDVLHDLMNIVFNGTPSANSISLITTTPIPTMHPKRRAELQGWSRQLLQQQVPAN